MDAQTGKAPSPQKLFFIVTKDAAELVHIVGPVFRSKEEALQSSLWESLKVGGEAKKLIMLPIDPTSI